MTAQTETQVTIRTLGGAPDALLCVYPGQMGPQDCYIALDLRDGSMWADYNGEIGNAIPFDVHHGIVRRYPIPVLVPATVNDLMEQIAPHAQAVVDHSDIVWDGNNHVAKLDDEAVLAEERISGDGIGVLVSDRFDPERWIGEGVIGILYDLESDVYWWDAGDWLFPVRDEVIARFAAGKTLDTLDEEYDGDGSSEDSPVLIGLTQCLESLQAEALDG